MINITDYRALLESKDRELRLAVSAGAELRADFDRQTNYVNDLNAKHTAAKEELGSRSRMIKELDTRLSNAAAAKQTAEQRWEARRREEGRAHALQLEQGQ